MSLISKIKNLYSENSIVLQILHYITTSIFLISFSLFVIESLAKSETTISRNISPELPIFAKIFIFLFIAILMPVLEELFFRYWIGRKFDYKTAFTFGIFTFLIPINFYNLPVFGIAYILVLIVCLISKKTDLLKKELDFRSNDNLILVTFISSLTFAYGHLYYFKDILLDYPDFTSLIIFLLFLTFGYSGLMLTNIRLKYGIKNSVIVHICNNSLSCLILLFGLSQSANLENLQIRYILITLFVLFLFLLFGIPAFFIGNYRLIKNIKLFNSLKVDKKLILTIIFFVILLSRTVVKDIKDAPITDPTLKNTLTSFPRNFNKNKIAIIDTPIFKNHKYINRLQNIEYICTLDTCECDFIDRCQHGTGVLSIISYLRPKSDITVFSSINSDSLSSKVDILNTLTLIYNSNIKYDIINLSINTSDLFNNNCDDFYPELTNYIKLMHERGTKIFVPTGNDGIYDKIAFPACISHVNSVGSKNSAGEKSIFSNSMNPMFAELGEDLLLPSFSFDKSDEYKQFSGTSYSSAIASTK